MIANPGAPGDGLSRWRSEDRRWGLQALLAHRRGDPFPSNAQRAERVDELLRLGAEAGAALPAQEAGRFRRLKEFLAVAKQRRDRARGASARRPR